MFWKILYWTQPYGVNQRSQSWWLLLDTINFNWYDFSDIRIVNIPDDYSVWWLNLTRYNRTTHGSGFGNWLIQDKTITIQGRIQAENQTELENIITRIKANLLVGEGTLYVKRKQEILKTTAVVSALNIPRETRTIDAIQITITFTIQNPFLYSVDQTEKALYDVNGLLNTTITYNQGSHSSQTSIFLVFNEATGVNQIKYTLWWKTIQINEAIQQGDIIFIDAEKKDISKNGVYGIDWVWEFGELNFWENILQVEINWTFTIDCFIQYRNTYV